MASDLSDLSDISDPEVASQEASQVVSLGEGQAQQNFRRIVNSAFAASAAEVAKHGLDVGPGESCWPLRGAFRLVSSERSSATPDDPNSGTTDSSYGCIGI